MKNIKIRQSKQIKRSKIKIFLVTLLIFMITILVGGAGLGYWEYKQALKKSEVSTPKEIKEKVEFFGEKDRFGKVNVLLIGIDARGKENSRTDSILIAQYNPDTKKSKLVSIMRDCYVEIPGYEESKHRINAAFPLGGVDLLRQTIKHNFDIDIEYYALIDFKGFSKMIDAAFPEGIEVNVEKNMSKGIDLTLHPGIQKLHGTELLGYVRFRHDALSDWGRIKRQQEVIQLIAENIINVQGVVKVPRMVGTVEPYIDTNMKKPLILSVMTSFISKNNRKIDTFRIPIDNSYKDITVGRAEVIDIDLTKNKQALIEFLN